MEYYLNNDIISSNLIFYHKGVRDDENINVFKCVKTEALVLDKIKKQNYTDNGISYWNCDNLTNARKKTYDDDYRRYISLKSVDYNSLLDFGCGNGGLLKLIKNKEIMGVELNKDIVNYMKEKENLNVVENINDIPINKKFDCIMLNHVLEHLHEPIDILKSIKLRMHDKSNLIIEVPHANDYLIKMNCEKFKKFTFWSEHLILHTEKTLTKLLKKAGFSKIKIYYYQRYNIFNHMKWLLEGKPGGHKTMKPQDESLIESYNNYLKKNKLTDTLIFHCCI